MRCIIIGAGGHSKVIIDATKKNGYEIVGLTDNNVKKGSIILGCEVIGNDDTLKEIYLDGICKAFMGIGHVGYPQVRNDVFKRIKKLGYEFPKLINPFSYIGEDVLIGEGTFIAAKAVVNAEATIGRLCVINSASVIEHEVKIKDGVHVAPNATVLGGAYVGENTFIGAGSTIIQSIKIGDNCIIGAGSVVLNDIPDNCVAVGVPAEIIKRR